MNKMNEWCLKHSTYPQNVQWITLKGLIFQFLCYQINKTEPYTAHPLFIGKAHLLWEMQQFTHQRHNQCRKQLWLATERNQSVPSTLLISFSPLRFTVPTSISIFKSLRGTFLVVQWLRFQVSTAGDAGLIPSWGTKIPHASHHSQLRAKEMVILVREHWICSRFH